MLFLGTVWCGRSFLALSPKSSANSPFSSLTLTIPHSTHKNPNLTQITRLRLVFWWHLWRSGTGAGTVYRKTAQKKSAHCWNAQKKDATMFAMSCRVFRGIAPAMGGAVCLMLEILITAPIISNRLRKGKYQRGKVPLPYITTFKHDLLSTIYLKS